MEVSLFTIPTIGGTLIGVTGLAQISNSAPLETWEKFGISGLLILVVVALWRDGKTEMKHYQDRMDKRDAEETAYRERREAMEAERMQKFVESLNAINFAIKAQADKCNMTNYLLEQIKRNGVSE